MTTLFKNPDLAKGKKRQRNHPGVGRKKASAYNSARQVDEVSRDEIVCLLGDGEIRRDLLIEYLHLIQDRFGYLRTRHMCALADIMKLPTAEVFEVASFYAHFLIVDDDDAVIPELTIRVCDSLSCSLRGASALFDGMKDQLDPKKVRVVRAPCMGRCDTAPVCEVGHRHIDFATQELVRQTIDEGDFHAVVADYRKFESYVDDGGYELLRSCRNGERSADELIETLSQSKLSGLGGAGFPTGRKWSIVRSYDGPRLMTVNGDEGEPGTFKDRYHLERDPHRFLEGALIAAWAVDVDKIYIYLRDEYPGIHEILKLEIDRLLHEGLVEPDFIELRRGAGAYICGEESAMIESIEGKRGIPRHRPPYIAEQGLFGRPTLNHNVETLFWVRDIVQKGPEWFCSQGRGDSNGFRSFSVSGRVSEPGVKLAPAGISVRELIDEYCGGMEEGHQFKAYLPGGASGGILPEALADIPLDFGGDLAKQGCFIGSHAVIILSDQDNMRDVGLNLMRFFEDESCGQCTPCRNGTTTAVKLMEDRSWNPDLMCELSEVMTGASICGLGQAASNPMLSILKHFPDEISGNSGESKEAPNG